MLPYRFAYQLNYTTNQHENQHMEHFDITIIGAGIAGAGIAAHLPADKNVLLLEAENQPGYHSTGRSAAAFVANYGNETIRALNLLSLPYFQAPERYGIEQPLLSERGELVLCRPGQDERFAAHLAENPDLQEVPIAEAYEWVPVLREGRFNRAAIEKNAYDIDVDLLHQAWLKTSAKRGHRLQCNTRVNTLQSTDAGWQVETTAGTFQSAIVVNAAGAWADNVAEMAAVPALGLTPKRRSIAVISPPPGVDITRWPLMMDTDEDWYAIPRSGKLLVSPADAEPVVAGDAYTDDLVLAEGIDRFEQATTISVDRVEHSWAGLRTFAPDNTPVVGFDSHAQSFFWLAGQGGYGIQTAPAMSQIAAALVLGGSKHPELEQALSPARFLKQ